MIAFPPRLPDQPIFYPVTREGYAVEIPRDWNARHNDDRPGHVTRFAVNESYLNGYQPQVFGARRHTEYWIPAEDRQDFNANIVGAIEVIGSFENAAS